MPYNVKVATSLLGSALVSTDMYVWDLVVRKAHAIMKHLK
jgi:hypothetical protein